MALALALSAVALGGCSDQPEPAPQLDEPAQHACDPVAPIAADVRRGDLEGPALYRALQDVWDAASPSQNADVRDSAQRLLPRRSRISAAR